MNKIERYTAAWCDIDRVDGADIVDGEPMRIRWPDGSESMERVRVEASSAPYQDHGHAYTMPVRRAYVERVIHGVSTRVWLREAGVEMERV